MCTEDIPRSLWRRYAGFYDECWRRVRGLRIWANVSPWHEQNDVTAARTISCIRHGARSITARACVVNIATGCRHRVRCLMATRQKYGPVAI